MLTWAMPIPYNIPSSHLEQDTRVVYQYVQSPKCLLNMSVEFVDTVLGCDIELMVLNICYI